MQAEPGKALQIARHRVVRWFRLPDWVATASVLVGVVTALWLQSEMWLPRSIWFLGLLARACRVVVSV